VSAAAASIVPPASVNGRSAQAGRSPQPLLHGEQLSQREFHRRYEVCSEDVTFELIGGTVCMMSPLRRPHATFDTILATMLTLYEAATPGVEAAHAATVILGPESEPQPDLLLRILSDFGGRTSVTPQQYIAGPPELVVEIADSTVHLDLHAKRRDYRRAGVAEYIVVCVEARRIEWFALRTNRKLAIDRDGVLRCKTFPGLWIDTAAALRRDIPQLVNVLQQGLASAEHARFVGELQVRHGAARRAPAAATRIAKPKKRKRRNGG
jgi:Uma2 family endonuclease